MCASLVIPKKARRFNARIRFNRFNFLTIKSNRFNAGIWYAWWACRSQVVPQSVTSSRSDRDNTPQYLDTVGDV